MNERAKERLSSSNLPLNTGLSYQAWTSETRPIHKHDKEPQMEPLVKAFFHEPTNTASYVVVDQETKVCAIVDPVLDYDTVSGRTSAEAADAIIHYIQALNLKVEWILESHVHADHLSAAPYVKGKLGGQIAISEHVIKVQHIFGQIFNVEDNFYSDDSTFDHLFKDGETFSLGALEGKAIHTPGHTPACMTYVIGNCAFVGDTLFMPDYGTARADFPGGDAETLYKSIQRIFALPDDTRLYLCHDYKAPGRDDYQWETTVAEERANNVHVHGGISRTEFVKFRRARDATLTMPRLILPSIQVNLRAGNLPPTEDNGKSYLKIPVDVL